MREAVDGGAPTGRAEPLVSMIVPAFDVAGLLPRCLDSLLAQTYRPLEIIVVDDGSSDATAAVMQRYERLHPEIHAIRQSHRGLGPARNAALDVARGEYVTMVDADDWLEPDFVADTVGIARDRQADVVVGNFAFHVRSLRAAFPFWPPQHPLTGEQAARLSLNVLRLPSFAWGRLYRKSLFHAEDAPFPSIYYEDLATTPRILARANRVVFTRRVYYHYCLRSDSIIGAFSAKNVFSFAAAIDLLRHDLQSLGRWDAWRRDYLRLLRQAAVLIPVQVVVQRNHIPLRARVPVLRRYVRRLRRLADVPDGKRVPAAPRESDPERPSWRP